MAEFKITIDGSKFPPVIKTEVEGMKGSGCATSLDQLQEVLRMNTQHQTLKQDFKEVKQRLPLRR